MRKILLIVPLLLGLASCEYEFSLEGRLESDPRLFFQFIAVAYDDAPTDTCAMYFLRTNPVNEVYDIRRDTVYYPAYDNTEVVDTVVYESYVHPKSSWIPDAVSAGKLSVKVNSHPLELHDAPQYPPNEYYWQVPEHGFYALHRFSPGDVVEMKAWHDDLKPVSAEVTVPEPVCDYEVRRMKSGDQQDSHILRYSGDGGFHAIAVDALSMIEDTVALVSVPINRQDETFDTASSSFFVMTFDGRTIAVWADKDASEVGGMREIAIPTPHVENSVRYHLYSLSPETYRYFRSLYSIRENFFSLLGLAPPQFSYTNVKDGAGCLGAMTATVTDWQ